MPDSFTFTVPMSPGAVALACLRLAAPALTLLERIAAMSGTTAAELLDRFAAGIQSEETAVPMLKDALTHAAEQMAAMQSDLKATHDALDAETAESDAAKGENEATKARLSELLTRFQPVVDQVTSLAQQGQAAPVPTPTESAPPTAEQPAPVEPPVVDVPVVVPAEPVVEGKPAPVVQTPVDAAPVDAAPVVDAPAAPATDAPPADGTEPAPAV